MKKVVLVRPIRKTSTNFSEKISKDMNQVDEVQRILDSIKLLSPSKQKELLARLSLQNQTLANGESRDVDMWSLAVYEALVGVDGSGDRDVPGPMVIKRLVGASTAWRPIKDFMEASKFDELKVTERQSIYYMLAKLVVAHAAGKARYLEIPLTVRFIAGCSVHVASIFDASFPGYLKSGLALMVAKSMQQH